MNKEMLLDGFLSLLWGEEHTELRLKKKKEFDCLPLQLTILLCIVTMLNIQNTSLHNAFLKREMQQITTVQ